MTAGGHLWPGGPFVGAGVPALCKESSRVLAGRWRLGAVKVSPRAAGCPVVVSGNFEEEGGPGGAP